MRERLVTLGCALGALLLFATLFLGPGQLDRERAAPPTSEERGSSGLLGALRWLDGEGVRTLSLRERFDTLSARRDVPPRGNLLIVTLPVVTPFKQSEGAALNRWVRAGNTVLVLAALLDRPAWASPRSSASSDLTLLTGVAFEPRTPAARTRLRQEPLPSALIPNRSHAYLDGVRSTIALSDYTPLEVWDVRLPRSGFVLSLAHERESGVGALWTRPDGSGTIIVSACGSLFSNRALGLADNARLLANIVAASVAPGAAVLFDDEHQGLAVAYDPARFYRDRRLYGTVGVLAAVWLVWVLGGTRLRLPQSRAAAPREVDLVRATGAFLARVLTPAAAARRMFENFFARLRPRAAAGAARQGPPWEWLENHPRLARADVRQLREWYADAYSERRVPLTRLHNLMVRTERQLAT